MSYMHIDRTQRIVQQIYVSLTIHTSGQTDSGLLSARQRLTALSDHRSITAGKRLKVFVQSAFSHHGMISLLIHGHSEEYILAYGTGKEPRLLAGV